MTEKRSAGGWRVNSDVRAEDFTAIDVECPTCDVAPGVHCTDMTRSGYRALKHNRSHGSRVGLAADLARIARENR